MFNLFRNGVQRANYFGSVTQSTTVHLGWDGKEQIYVPFNKILPLVDPNNLIIGGWDINNANLYEAAQRARVGYDAAFYTCTRTFRFLNPNYSTS